MKLFQCAYSSSSLPATGTIGTKSTEGVYQPKWAPCTYRGQLDLEIRFLINGEWDLPEIAGSKMSRRRSARGRGSTAPRRRRPSPTPGRWSASSSRWWGARPSGRSWEGGTRTKTKTRTMSSLGWVDIYWVTILVGRTSCRLSSDSPGSWWAATAAA